VAPLAGGARVFRPVGGRFRFGQGVEHDAEPFGGQIAFEVPGPVRVVAQLQVPLAFPVGLILVLPVLVIDVGQLVGQVPQHQRVMLAGVVDQDAFDGAVQFGRDLVGSFSIIRTTTPACSAEISPDAWAALMAG
jgi:hypothetical protein